VTIRHIFGTLALAATTWQPVRVHAQTGAQGPELTAAEVESLQMAQEMTFMCNPQRHQVMTGSESMIRRTAGDLPGTAALIRSAEGTFLVLEAYDDSQAGHCLVLGWFGGELEAGTYPIRQLAMATLEEEVDTGRHAFFTFTAVRAPDESSTLVTEAGTLEIESMEPGRLTGSFSLSGFSVEGGTRTDGVSVQGSFTALEQDGL